MHIEEVPEQEGAVNKADITYTEFQADDAAALADFLLENPWPFHGAGASSRESILKRAEDGGYWNGQQRTFWINDGSGSRIGLIQLKEIGDPTPLFDLRLAGPARGKGTGTEALRWLTRYLFENIPTVRRIEGYTRIDNTAMRNAFRKAGYLKEAHHRKAWSSPAGIWYDAIGYCMLREDWETGTTTPLAWEE